MTRVLRSEMIKLRTTRMWWGLLLGTLGLVALNVLPSALLAGQSFGPGILTTPPLSDPAGLTAAYGSGYQAGYLMALLLGVVIGAVDLRHRTATQTFLATPQRGRVVVAKMIVGALAGMLYGAVTQVTTVLVAAPVVVAKGAPLRLGDATILPSLALGVPGVALWAVVGVALGILLRNQIAAILVALFYVFVGDFLLAGALSLLDLSWLARFTPNNASTAIVQGITGFELLPWWGGVGVLLLYGVVISTLGWLVGRHRDIA